MDNTQSDDAHSMPGAIDATLDCKPTGYPDTTTCRALAQDGMDSLAHHKHAKRTILKRLASAGRRPRRAPSPSLFASHLMGRCPDEGCDDMDSPACADKSAGTWPIALPSILDNLASLPGAQRAGALAAACDLVKCWPETDLFDVFTRLRNLATELSAHGLPQVLVALCDMIRRLPASADRVAGFKSIVGLVPDAAVAGLAPVLIGLGQCIEHLPEDERVTAFYTLRDFAVRLRRDELFNVIARLARSVGELPEEDGASAFDGLLGLTARLEDSDRAAALVGLFPTMLELNVAHRPHAVSTALELARSLHGADRADVLAELCADIRRCPVECRYAIFLEIHAQWHSLEGDDRTPVSRLLQQAIAWLPPSRQDAAHLKMEASEESSLPA